MRSDALTTVQFIQRAKAVHGVGTYDYSQVVYAGSRSKIKIICYKHGAFEQIAGGHIRGQGCPICGRMKSFSFIPITTAEFIAKAEAVHGVGTYDYSQVVYAGALRKINIVCLVHGIFRQTPTQHYEGGCSKCGHLQVGQIIAGRAAAEFIAKAEAVHGVGTYDYSQVVYVKAAKQISINCPAHGVYKQTPNSHLGGAGCPVCYRGKLAAQYALTTAEFIAKAEAVHGVGTYDYSQVVYVNTRKPVSIKCTQHGIFWQRPGVHCYRGSGCPSCTNGRILLGWVANAANRICNLYLLRIYSETESFFKVGITFRDVNQRFRGGRLLGGYKYEVVALHQSNNAAAVAGWEQAILTTFAGLRYKPARYFPGESECFSSCEEILEIFPL